MGIRNNVCEGKTERLMGEDSRVSGVGHLLGRTQF